jgi:ribosomal protein L12E/L44/L45/RPP1/RPP2
LQARDARNALLAAYTIAMPSPVRKTASRSALAAENDQLRSLLKAAGIELDKNYAQMVLMERENGNMRQQLHAKKNKPKRTYTTGKARLMTSAEMAQALLDELQKKQMAELHSELRKNIFPGIKKAIDEAAKAAKAKARAAEQAAKAAAKRAEQEAKAAAKAAEKAKKAAEREAAKAAKAAARARGRGQGRARGARRRAGVVGGGGRGRGKAQDSSNKEESGSESESSDEETDLDEPDVGAAPGPSTTTAECSDEETDLEEPAVSVSPTPSAATAPLAVQDESDDDNELDQEETGIVSFNGHRWEKRRNLEFQVVWTDCDVTWEPLANVNDCVAMEEYLAYHDLDDPLLLSRHKFLIDKAKTASNE